ncbi:4-amino-4-deoxy-L-arabinose transferase [Nocardioides sp.]|uniref:uridine kinase family protein n=1 Tax=Nocardioides sp. TaxID=35761 RepID=UPI0031FE6A4A
MAELLLGLVGSRPATLGAGRLLCIDGPAASGKSTLAAEVAALVPGTVVVQVDDLLDGWEGLPTVDLAVDRLLRPLARDEASSYRRYDWDRGRFAETVPVEPAPLLVLEGCGAGSRRSADLATLIVWVSAPTELRVTRGVERDGERMRARQAQWLLDEAELFAAEDTRARADVEVDGTGASAPVVRPRPGGGCT